MRNKVKNCKTPPSLPTSSQVQLHSFTPDSSTSSLGNGGQSVTVVVGSAVPAPWFSLGPLHGLQSFWINPVWVFHRLRFLLGNACLLVWIPPGAIRNLSSGTCSTSSPSFCFQLGVHMAAAHFCPAHPLPVQYFLPHLKSSFPEVPLFGLSHALWCVSCIQHRVALASPCRGSCRPHCQHLDSYTQCTDLQKSLLKMTEKGVGCITCLQLPVKKKKPLLPSDPHSGCTTYSMLADFLCLPTWLGHLTLSSFLPN